MKGSAAVAAISLVCGYAHYALIAHFGGSPVPVVVWLGLFAAALVVMMKQAIDQI